MESHLKDSVLSQFIGGTIYSSVGQITTVVLGMLSLMITTRWVPTEDLGAYFLLLTIEQLVLMASSLGINTSITKQLADINNVESKNELISTAFYFKLLVLIAVSILLMLFKGILLMLFGASFYPSLIIYIPILLTIDSLYTLLSSIYEGLFKFKLLSFANILVSISSFLSVVAFVVWLDMGLAGRIYALILSRILGLILACYLVKFRLLPTFSLKIMKRLFKFGFPLYINQILSLVFIRIDTMIIAALLGPADIALYEIAKKIPDSLETLYTSFRRVYFPIISKVHAKGEFVTTAALINNTNRIIAFLGFFGSIITFAFGKEILHLIFSDKYLASFPAFVLSMIALTISIIDETLGYSLIAIGSPGKPPIISTIRAIFNLTGYIFLVPSIGIAGAASARVISTIIVNPINIIFLNKKKINANFSAYTKPFLIFISASVLLLNNPASFLLRIFVVIVFIMSSFIFSVFSLEDFSIIIQGISNFLTRYRNKASQH